MPTVNKRISVEGWVADTNDIATGIGDISDLPVGDTTVVGAINTIETNIGDLSDLTTADQTDLVTATNEAIANALVITLAIGTTVN